MSYKIIDTLCYLPTEEAILDNIVSMPPQMAGYLKTFGPRTAPMFGFKPDELYKMKITMSQSELKDALLPKVKKFAMPNVQVGSIIEYKYSIETPYKFNLKDWEFQRKIPTIYSEYTVRMVPFYEYTYLMQGVDKFDIQNSYKVKLPNRK